MHRRMFACACLGSLFASSKTSAFTDKAVGGNDAPKVSDPSTPRLLGCVYLGAVSGLDGAQFKLSPTTSIPALDAGIAREYQFLGNLLTVRPGFFMFDDSSGGNAFATPERLGNHIEPDGTVCFGKKLMMEEYRAAPPPGRFDHVMAAIMAHEWAHIQQFQRVEKPPPGKPMELHADQMAGWYMGIRSKQLAGAVDVSSAMKSFFGKGDYEFLSPQHHGTPAERVHAFNRGQAMAQNGFDNERAFKTARKDCGL